MKVQRGQRVGKLFVLERADPIKTGGRTYARWKCRCDCGNICTIRQDCLRTKHTRSCGCGRRVPKRPPPPAETIQQKVVKVLCVARGLDGVTLHSVTRLLQLSEKTASRLLGEMVDAGYLDKVIGRGRGMLSQYTLAEEGRKILVDRALSWHVGLEW